MTLAAFAGTQNPHASIIGWRFSRAAVYGGG